MEYRDGSGEVWRFLKSASSYTAPIGLPLKLTATPYGWNMLDQKLRITSFDSLGRIVSESDQFYDLKGGGNLISYFYDQKGRLGNVVDPVGRVSTLTYFDDCSGAQDCFLGSLKEIADWRQRKVTFHYDAKGNLITVDKPETKNPDFSTFAHTGSNRPSVHYTYKSAGSALQDFIDLAGDLESIREPADTTARVTFHYDDTGAKRDFVKTQDWGTADNPTATFNFTVASISELPSTVTVTDTRKQRRTYTLAGSLPPTSNADRPHLHEVVEENVPSWSGAAFGELPASISVNGASSVTNGNRITTYGYENGRLKTVSTDSGASTTIGYEDAQSGDHRQDGAYHRHRRGSGRIEPDHQSHR